MNIAKINFAGPLSCFSFHYVSLTAKDIKMKTENLPLLSLLCSVSLFHKHNLVLLFFGFIAGSIKLTILKEQKY